MTSGKLASCGAPGSRLFMLPAGRDGVERGISHDLRQGGQLCCTGVLLLSAPGASMLQCKSQSVLRRFVTAVANPAAKLHAEPSLTGCQALSSLALPSVLGAIFNIRILKVLGGASPLGNEIVFTCLMSFCRC